MWKRDREIAFLRSELERVKGDAWRLTMELLDKLGVLDAAVRSEKVSSWGEMRRVVSRLKEVL